MTKHDLAKELARAEQLTQSKALSCIENILDLIVCHFAEGGTQVTLRGFGTLNVRKRRAFTVGGCVPVILVPERKSVILKPSAEMLRRINN